MGTTTNSDFTDQNNGQGIPLSLSDINGDGRSDVIVGGSNEAVRIFHSVGGATPITNDPTTP
ncbi:FG-GAP repeat protein, partial [Leptospira interrogans]|nr:FG-GAP repeat protein [Leptospira interrogans]